MLRESHWEPGALGSGPGLRTGQVQSRSGPQFLLQIMKGPGFGTEGPSSSDSRVGSGLGFPFSVPRLSQGCTES